MNRLIDLLIKGFHIEFDKSDIDGHLLIYISRRIKGVNYNLKRYVKFSECESLDWLMEDIEQEFNAYWSLTDER